MIQTAALIAAQGAMAECAVLTEAVVAEGKFVAEGTVVTEDTVVTEGTVVTVGVADPQEGSPLSLGTKTLQVAEDELAHTGIGLSLVELLLVQEPQFLVEPAQVEMRLQWQHY